MFKGANYHRVIGNAIKQARTSSIFAVFLRDRIEDDSKDDGNDSPEN